MSAEYDNNRVRRDQESNRRNEKAAYNPNAVLRTAELGEQ